MHDTADTDDPNTEDTDRRSALKGIAALASVGIAYASGFFSRSVSADPEGNVGTSANPWATGYFETLTFVGRTSDPASPEDGTMWYREDR